MKWLDERPRPIHEAWNILCDAVEERIEAFKIVWGSDYLLPRVPEPPFYKTKFDVSGLRGKIITLIKYSFFPPWFGNWCDLSVDNLGIDRPDGEFYRQLGINSYAFFCTAGSDGPNFKYSLNNFIHAAAEIVNNAIIYPLPGRENSDRAGFLLDADLELETFEPAYSWKGRYSSNGQKVVYLDDATIMAYPYQLVFYLQKNGRSRASNLRWKYCKAGELMKNPSPFPYYNPVLLGKGKLRMGSTHFTCTDPEAEDRYQKKVLDSEEFVIDFPTGLADKEIDVSGVQKWISRYWNFPVEEDLPDIIYRVILEKAAVQIMLQRENFPAVNYKYLA